MSPRYDLSLNNRSAYFIESSSNLSGLSITLVSTSPGFLCVVIDVALSTCLAKGVDMVTLVSLLARGATRRAQLLWILTLDLSLTAATGRLLRFLLTGLTPASPGPLRSTLSLGALRSTRQQVGIPVFREAITAPLPCCECMWRDVPCTNLFCARRGAAGSCHTCPRALRLCAHKE